MTVIIEGMKMPKKCEECDFVFPYEVAGGIVASGCSRTGQTRETYCDTRPVWCPLDEVPTPHDDLSDLISRSKVIQWIKTECNPYGNPTLDFESGKKVIKHLEQMPSAQPSGKRAEEASK